MPSPGDLPDPGIEPRSPTLQADALPSEPPGKPLLSVLASETRFFCHWYSNQVQIRTVSALLSNGDPKCGPEKRLFIKELFICSVSWRFGYLLLCNKRSQTQRLAFCCVANGHKLRDLQLRSLSQSQLGVSISPPSPYFSGPHTLQRRGQLVSFHLQRFS